MVILTPQEMRAAEEAVFARGVSAEALMEKAGLGIAQAIRERWPAPGKVTCYLGKGNNGGDALVAARHLQRWGWQVELHDVEPGAEVSPLSRKKRAACLAEAVPRRAVSNRPWIQLDGLLGIGAFGPLRPAFQICTQEMNRHRTEQGAFTIALDIPTGLDGTTGDAQPDTVQADLTLTIAYGKPGLLADQAEPYVGSLALIPLPEITAPCEGGDRQTELVTADLLAPWRKRRPIACFKNQAGRATLVAGSAHYAGAAILCAEGALASGAGLVTLCAPQSLLSWVAPRLSPEIMLRALPASATDLSDLPGDAFGVGPGLGAEPPDGLLAWLAQDTRSMVIDADGLNLLARHPEALRQVATVGSRLVTPHPGEFRRLFSKAAALPTRREQAARVAEAYPLTLLYKGTRTVIAQSGHPLRINLTGNPGMASGGMGDILTGICTGLAAQGYTLNEAACLGAWLCGQAADHLIATGRQTHETLRASHVLCAFPSAFGCL